MSQFGFTKKELPYFKTIHSLAFQQLGLKRDEVLQSKHLREIGKHLGLTFSTRQDIEEGIPGGRFKGDRYTFLDSFARARRMTPEQAWHLIGGEDDLDWYEFKRFIATLTEYKRQRGMMDFSDMLTESHGCLDIDVLILDEGQDCSSIQWQFVREVLGGAKRTYISGDDDQAIYQWSGADVPYFQNLSGDRELLHQSHRVPRAIHRIAEKISSRIGQRYIKPYLPRPEAGRVEYHMSPDDVDLSQGSWLLLARNTHLLSQLAGVVRSQGIPYNFRGESTINKSHIRAIRAWEKQRRGDHLDKDELGQINEWLPKRGMSADKIWHEALVRIPIEEREFYISLLRKGESLTKEPRISIGTIHSAKGGEADNVMLISDMSARTWNGFQTDPDSEHRVWYVGATRARQNLNIIQPTSRMAYEI